MRRRHILARVHIEWHMEEFGSLTGEELNILAVAYANAIASGMSAQSLAVLACVFTVIGDALATLSATRGNDVPANA